MSMKRDATPKISRWGRWAGLICCAALCGVFFVLSWTAKFGKSATVDEPGHFVAAWMQIHDWDFRNDPQDPALWKYWAALGTRASDLPIARDTPFWPKMLNTIWAEGYYSGDALFQSSVDVDGLLRSARAKMAVLGALLAAVIGWWAWRIAGAVAAVAATAAFCLDPNFLAHASIVKNDVPMTLAFTALMAMVWLCGEKVTLVRLLGFGLVVGATMTIKFSGIIALPLAGLAFCFRAAIRRPWPNLQRTAQTFKQRMGVASVLVLSGFVLGYCCIWACYGFRFGPSENPNESFDAGEIMHESLRSQVIKENVDNPNFTEKQLRPLTDQRVPSRVDRLYLWADEHRMFPQAWLRGLYETIGLNQIRPSYLCGQYSKTGWWYYFPLAMAFKTPLATLAALGLALAYYLARGRQWRGPAEMWTICALGLLPAIYMVIAMRQPLDLGIRHVLPVYPGLFIAIGVAVGAAWRWRPKLCGGVAGVLLLGLAAETVCAYPNYIPFFNAAAGGSRGGLYLLGDSNLDWGQDILAVVDWQKSHPDRRLYLCYFGSVDPRYYHLHYVKAPGSQAEKELHEPGPSVRPPVLAISATLMQGIYLQPKHRAFYAPLMHRPPTEVFGGSIYLFDGVDDLFPQQ